MLPMVQIKGASISTTSYSIFMNQNVINNGEMEITVTGKDGKENTYTLGPNGTITLDKTEISMDAKGKITITETGNPPQTTTLQTKTETDAAGNKTYTFADRMETSLTITSFSRQRRMMHMLPYTEMPMPIILHMLQKLVNCFLARMYRTSLQLCPSTMKSVSAMIRVNGRPMTLTRFIISIQNVIQIQEMQMIL